MLLIVTVREVNMLVGVHIDQITKPWLITLQLQRLELIDYTFNDQDPLIGDTFPVMRLYFGAINAKTPLQQINLALELICEHLTLIKRELKPYMWEYALLTHAQHLHQVEN